VPGDGRATVTVTAHDDHFAPVCIEGNADQVLTLVVRNAGRHPHNLTLETGESVSVDSGQAAFITAAVGPSGATYVCTIHPGMEGRILLRP
jgi:plastocyanin